MPSSHFYQITGIVEIITAVDPQKLLDIGIGFGKYGFLAREYLELWDGRQKYNDFKRIIDGIEVFPEYIKPIQKNIYNNIFTGNAIDIVSQLILDYNLTLFVDCLEHFSYADGMKVLETLEKKSDNILISVPLFMSHQKDAFGNEFETHKYQWTKKDFKKFQDKFFLMIGNSLIVFIGKDFLKVKEKLKNNKKKLISAKHNGRMNNLKQTVKKFLKK